MRSLTDTLGRVRVAAPCAEDWDEMRGDERVRFCQRCSLNVYNLSAMSRREAERLVLGAEGRLCVRFYRRRDGTILTQNCPTGLAKLKRRVSRAASATAAAAISLLAGVSVAPTTERPEQSAPSVATAPLPTGEFAATDAVVKPETEFAGEDATDFTVAGGMDLAPADPVSAIIPLGVVSGLFALLLWPLGGLLDDERRRRLEKLRIWSNEWSRPDANAALPREGSAVDPNQ